MKYHTIYDSTTGRVIRVGMRSMGQPPAVAGETEVEGVVDGGKYYFVSGVVTDRPLMPFHLDRDGVLVGDKLTFSSLPAGVEVNVDGDIVQVDDGTLEVTFDTPGMYRVTMRLFPYLDKEVWLTCS